MNKKLYQAITEKQVIAVLLASSEEECQEYLLENSLVNNLNNVSIIEVAKKDKEEEEKVIPLMVAKKFTWYDLRHYRHLYIYKR